MRIHAIVLAGGMGDRFGAEMPKQFVRLAGEPILIRSIRAIVAAGVDRLVVVTHASWLAETRDLITGVDLSIPVLIVPGGATRNESTRNGLAALDADDEDVVLIHDAVRPLVPVEVVLRSIEPILSGRADATDTVIPTADTLVIVEGDLVTEIPDRARFRRGQTPQSFRMGILARAYALAEAAGEMSATDDCSVVLRYLPAARIVAVPGDEVNLKITTRTDMVLADRMIQLRTLAASDEPHPTRPLAGARLYVIGGTNGIGQAIAELARAGGGATVVDGRRTGLDIRDYAAVEKHLAMASERMGGIDHVVCTAGVLKVGRMTDLTPADMAEIIDVNVSGSLNVARAAHPYLSESRGSLTLFASSSFTQGRPNYVAYSASKAALVNVVQGLADEWASDGIRVNAVSPERTDTQMRRAAFPNESPIGLLPIRDVAVATLRLVQSDLTGQVLDVRRHDGVAQAAAGPVAPAGDLRTGPATTSPGRDGAQ